MEKDVGLEGNGFDPKGPGWDDPKGMVFEENAFKSVVGGNVVFDVKSEELA